MTSLVNIFVLLVGIVICLTQETLGEYNIEKEVIEGAGNNLINDVLIKREAIPESKKGGKEKRKGKPGIKKRNTKKGKPGIIKRNTKKGKPGIKKRNTKKGKPGIKKRNTKKGKKNHKKGSKKFSRKKTKKDKETQQKNKGAKRRVKQRKGKKKKITKNGNQRIENRKESSNGDNKWRKHKKIQEKNSKLLQKGKKIKTKTKLKNLKDNIEGRVDDVCPTDAVIIISKGIISYRKYFNHEKKIIRTNRWLKQFEKKAAKVKPYTTAADELAHVTANGSSCPGDPAKKDEATIALARLRECADTTNSPIVKACNKSVIPHEAIMEADINKCIVNDIGKYSTYPAWIAGFKDCFENDQTCACFLNMNVKDQLGDVPNDPLKPTFSCQKPAQAADGDWIENFMAATKTALDNCKVKVGECKVWVTKAAALTSVCCKTMQDGGSTPGIGRRLKQQLFIKKQLQKINMHRL